MSKNPFQNFVVGFTGGDTIYEEGDAGITMYIVQTGSVRLLRRIDGRTHELGVMEKGDFFGEMSVLEGLPRPHTALAEQDCDLIEISSTTFDKMIRSNIEIAVRMLRKLSIRLREAERQLNAMPVEIGAAEAAPVEASAPEPSPNETLNGAIIGPRLECSSENTTFQLNPSETLVGRFDPVTEVRPDVDLTEVDLKRSVSRRHARILTSDDGLVIIEEVGALNGTFVNGRQLTPGEPCPVAEGDELSFGMVSTILRV